MWTPLHWDDRLVGPAVKASASRASDPEFNSRFIRGNFSGSSHTSDLVKVSASRASDPEFNFPLFPWDFFPVRVIPVIWLRRPPPERQTRSSIPAFSVGFLSGSSHTSDLLKASASRASDPEFNSRFFRGIFVRFESYQ